MLEPVSSGNVRVADVGAGTGKFTRVLHSLPGVEVVAVEPDEEMLAALRDAVPGVLALPGRAEDLPLEDGSVDAVTLAQAWHWVDPESASAEIGRVVRPGGVLGLIWNGRDERESWVRRLGEIMNASDLMPRTVAGGVEIGPPFGHAERFTCEWTHLQSRSQVHDMVASRSYVITASAAEQERIHQELDELLDGLEFDSEGRVALPYVTTAFRAVRKG